MSNLNKYFFGIFAAFSLTFTAFAQEVEEVVVTATKKSESIQDLALSIEALSSDDVQANMIQDSDDLAEDEEFQKLHQVPMLLNTSLNLAGDPIVNSYEDLLDMMNKSSLKYSYLADFDLLINT